MGHNHLTQDLFYNRVWDTSCNLLDAALKGKSRIGHRVPVIYLCEGMADWELEAAAPQRQDHSTHLSLGKELQFKTGSSEFTQLLQHEVEKS